MSATPPPSPPSEEDGFEMELGAACPIIEQGGAEIVILEDGRVRIVNPTEEAIELAFELDPENEAVRKRMDVIRELREKRDRPTS
jgi:hypothetical protein